MVEYGSLRARSMRPQGLLPGNKFVVVDAFSMPPGQGATQRGLPLVRVQAHVLDEVVYVLDIAKVRKCEVRLHLEEVGKQGVEPRSFGADEVHCACHDGGVTIQQYPVKNAEACGGPEVRSCKGPQGSSDVFLGMVSVIRCWAISYHKFNDFE